MESTEPTVYVEESKDGVARVKKGGYAYFGESSSVEYVIERECDLMQVGGWLDSKGYGIALPRSNENFLFSFWFCFVLFFFKCR